MDQQSTVDDNPKAMRLGDFMAMDRVPDQEPEGQFDAAGYFQVTEDQRKEWEAQGPIGYFEAAQRVDKTEMIPFLGGVESIVKSVKLKNAVDRIQADNYEFAPGKKAQDLDMVNKFLFKIAEEQVRGVTLGGKITTGAAELPAFMIEFLATAGIASLGKEGVKQTVKHTVKGGLRSVVKSTVKKAAMRAAGATAGAITRTTIGMPHRVVDQYLERQLNSQLQLTEKGYKFLESAQEKPFTSFMKAYGDVVIENLSEVTGPALSAGAKKLVPKKFAQALAALHQKMHPEKGIVHLFTKAGYNGFLEELGEERVGDLIRAIVGVEDFGAGDGASVLDRVWSSIPNGEEFMVEAGILMIPGAARATGSQAVQLYRNRVKQTPKERRPGNIVIDEETGEPMEIDGKVLTEKEADQIVAAIEKNQKLRDEGKPVKEGDPEAEEIKKEKPAPTLEQKIKKIGEDFKRKETKAKKEVKAVQEEIIKNLNESKLQAKDKAKFIKAIKNIQTAEQFEKQMPEIEQRIQTLESKAVARKSKAQIKKELKNIAPVKQAGKPVGKFTPEIQRILDKLAEASKLKKSEAQERARANVEMLGDRMPTAEEALENRMLMMMGGFEESTDEGFINDLLEEIQTIKSTGRAGKLLRDFATAERQEQMRKDAKESIVGDKAPEKTTRDQKESRIKNALKSFFIGQYGWNDKMDFLSQDDKSSKENESRLSQMMRVDREIQNEKGGIRRNGEKVVDMFARAFGFTGNRRKRERSMLRQMRRDSKIINLGNFTNRRGEYIKLEISKAQARKLWMELQDPTLRESLTGEEQVAAGFAEIRGNAYSQEMIDAINTFLTAEDKAFALDQLKFYRDYWKTINKVYQQRYGVDLPFNDFYSPIRRKNYNTESGNEFLQDIGIRRSVASGSLKSRQPNLRELALQNDMEVLQRHIIEMEHFKAWAGKIRDINAVFDGSMRELIKQKYGSPIMQSIDFHIQNFTSGGVEKAKGFEKILEILRINFTQSALAVKPALTVKQMVSFVAFADNIPTVDFVRGVGEFLANPVAKSKILMEGSELLKNRGKDFTRDVKDAFNSQEFNALRVTPSFKNMLMFTTRWGDKGAILLGGWSVYSYNIRQGKSHEEAIIEFERATASAQQSGDLDQLSDWQRGGPLAKMFTMFTSSQNQYFRKEAGAIRNLIKGRISPAKAAKKILIYHFILPMFFQWVSDFGKWDEDEQLRAAVLGSFNGIFILKDMLDTIVRLGIKGAKDSDISVFNSELEAFAFADGVYKAMRHIDPNDIWMEDIIEASKDLAEGTAGPISGFPVKQIFNAAEGLEDLGEGDTAEGALKLGGWSPYIVEKKIDKPGIF